MVGCVDVLSNFDWQFIAYSILSHLCIFDVARLIFCKQKGLQHICYKPFCLRRVRDSNPRTFNSQRFSRPPQSTTLPTLRRKSTNSDSFSKFIFTFFQNKSKWGLETEKQQKLAEASSKQESV